MFNRRKFAAILAGIATAPATVAAAWKQSTTPAGAIIEQVRITANGEVWLRDPQSSELHRVSPSDEFEVNNERA
jgi:hypothetical protein